MGLCEPHGVQQGQVEGPAPGLGQSQGLKDLKDLKGVWVEEKLNMTHQYVLAAQKSSRTLGCTNINLASRARERIVPLSSVLVRPQLEPCTQLWGPQHRV